jgi:hypothetical protein
MDDPKQLDIVGSQSPIEFIEADRQIGGDMSRYLTVNGERVFEVGIDCDSHGFWFERLGPAADFVTPANVREKLAVGLTELDGDVLAAFEPLLPDGRYFAVLSRIKPRLIHPGAENDYFVRQFLDAGFGERDPKTDYYRGRDVRFAPPSASHVDTAALFECLVPLYEPSGTQGTRVAEYKEIMHKGGQPTAVALSILDVSCLRDWGDSVTDVYEHWGLVHYLLDGHHKAHAASEVVERSPARDRYMTLLWFLAIDHSLASGEEFAKLAGVLQTHRW